MSQSQLFNLKNPVFMKTFQIFLVLVLSTLAVKAQDSSLEIYTHDGEKFTLFVNGTKQNATPQSSVSATGLKGQSAQIRIAFAKAGTPEISRGVPLTGGHVTGQLKKNNQGAYQLTWENAAAASSGGAGAPLLGGKQTVVQGSQGVQAKGDGQQQQQGQWHTQGQGGVKAGGNKAGAGGNVQQQNTQQTQQTTQSNPNYSKGQSSSLPNCNVVINQEEFSAGLRSIGSQPFEDTKFTIAKQLIRENCLYVSQVREVMNMFVFEETKLDFAKIAYPRTIDRKNYYQLNDAFIFASSIDELDEFIQSQR
jgi:hypothetical protein